MSELKVIHTLTDSNKKEIPELIPLSRWNDYFPHPSKNAMYQYNFYGHRNGFSKVVRRIGKRIYISVSDFFEWVNNNTGERACY